MGLAAPAHTCECVRTCACVRACMRACVCIASHSGEVASWAHMLCWHLRNAALWGGAAARLSSSFSFGGLELSAPEHTVDC